MAILTGINLQGKYSKYGNRLVKDNVKLLWCKRKRGLDRKPEDYLLIWNEEQNKYNYLSSLYSLGKNKYRLDNRRERFILQVKSDSEVWIWRE